MFRIGHRGAAAYAPENTLVSIQRATELAVDFVEIDVQPSSDGVIVLMHDKRVDRTTDGTGYVREMAWSSLRHLKHKIEPLPIPRLEEALEAVRDKAQLIIELIDPSIVKSVIRIVEDVSVIDQVVLASFHHKALLVARSIASNLRTLALMEGVPISSTRFARDARCTHAGLSVDSITAEFVGDLQRSGFVVFAYTANDERDMRWMGQIGVDGIVSDRPDIIEESLRYAEDWVGTERRCDAVR
jgi:glycerophosphoryl diester phosphodiesterase